MSPEDEQRPPAQNWALKSAPPSRTTLWRMKREFRQVSGAEAVNQPSGQQKPYFALQAENTSASRRVTSAVPQGMGNQSRTAPPSSPGSIQMDLDISFLQSDVLQRSIAFLPDLQRLVFRHNPVDSGPATPRPVGELLNMNTGLLALISDHPQNQHFLAYERYLLENRLLVESLLGNSDGAAHAVVESLFTVVTNELERLEGLRVKAWSRQRIPGICVDQGIDTGQLRNNASVTLVCNPC